MTSLVAIWILAAIPVMTQQPAPEPLPSSRAPDGAWSVGTVVEPESVEDVRAALVTTADGFTLAVAREPTSSRVIGILRLPPADRDFLDEALGIELQIDDGARLEPKRLGGGLKSSTFFLWDGVGDPVVGPLRELMDAKQRMRVQYPLAGGGYKVIELPVADAKSAIATVLGVPEEVTPEARDLALARQEAVERCFGEAKPKDRDRCLQRLAGCAEASSAETLRSCIAGAKK